MIEGTSTPQLKEFDTRSEAEAFYSHTHLTDIFEHRWVTIHDEEFDLDKPDPNDPEHILSWYLAQNVAQMWLQKLRLDFPEYRFRVYATRYDDPIVRFHRVREDDPLWLEEDQGTDPTGQMTFVVYDSANYRVSEPRA